MVAYRQLFGDEAQTLDVLVSQHFEDFYELVFLTISQIHVVQVTGLLQGRQREAALPLEQVAVRHVVVTGIVFVDVGTVNQFCQNAAQAPYVNSLVVVLLQQNYFW